MDFYIYDPCDSGEGYIDLVSYPFKDVKALTERCGFNPTFNPFDGEIETAVSLNGHEDGGIIEITIMRGTSDSAFFPILNPDGL